MSGSRGQKELPDWVIPTVIVVGVLLVVFIAWKALTGSSGGAPGPDREVHANMYDFRKEAEKGNLGRRTTGEGDNTH